MLAFVLGVLALILVGIAVGLYLRRRSGPARGGEEIDTPRWREAR